MKKFLSKLVEVAILVLLVSFLIMLLWNWLVPKIFGLVEISLWEALGLNILSGILFRQTHKLSRKD